MRAEPRNAFRLSIPAFGLALTVASPAPAQNTSSFLDAGDSAVRYTATPARPVMACQDLLGLTGHEFAIVSARSVPADGEVPGHCRVDGVIPQEIRFQVNLPDAWNRRFYMHGNGGYAGEQPEDPSRTWYRDAALAHGFATAFTDTGHDGGAEPLATFAYNDPAKEIDYAFRAVHLTVGVAKGLIGRFYGRPPAYSYWDGCSTGGRQGLMSA